MNVTNIHIAPDATPKATTTPTKRRVAVLTAAACWAVAGVFALSGVGKLVELWQFARATEFFAQSSAQSSAQLVPQAVLLVQRAGMGIGLVPSSLGSVYVLAALVAPLALAECALALLLTRPRPQTRRKALYATAALLVGFAAITGSVWWQAQQPQHGNALHSAAAPQPCGCFGAADALLMAWGGAFTSTVEFALLKTLVLLAVVVLLLIGNDSTDETVV